MGTRSTIHFYDGDDKTPLVSIYQQYDGYPSGVGLELAEFLAPIIMVNGFTTAMRAGTHANGLGCLAAQFIAKCKKKALGGLYITSPDDTQDYDYHVRVSKDDNMDISVTVISLEGKLFTGNAKDFLAWCLSSF